LEVLQKRSGSPILTALVHREQQRRYTLKISPAVTPSTLQDAGKGCLHILEEAILTAPEQWYQWKEFGKVLSAQPKQRVPAVVQPEWVPPGSILDYAHA
jgi:KDO2-lipid IV(A) lauroyltransferase